MILAPSKLAKYCIISPGHDNLEPLVEKNAYNLDVEAYIDWLDRGVAAFEKSTALKYF